MPEWSLAPLSAGPAPVRAVAGLVAAWTLAACTPPAPGIDVDVLVIGGGIAGLAASLEASAAGADVITVEMNSVGGGHAVMAGGLFLVGTPLQEAKGVRDTPELAIADIMSWGEDSDAEWVKRYVTDSREQVHDWLAGFGVEFALLLPAPGETSVPRFHFTRGAAVNVVVPMMRAAFSRDRLRLRFNSEATGLRPLADGGWEVTVTDRRTGESSTLRATAIIVATGGFENDLQRVRANWLPGIAMPERLLAGAGHFARGSGLVLGEQAGATLGRLDHQTIFVTGIPNPRDPDGTDGLLAQNPAAIFVDSNGRRFMDESSARKTLETTVLALPDQAHWLIFDSQGKRRLQIRGGPWLNRDNLEREILGNADLVQQADSIPELAERAGLPADALAASVADFNRRLATNETDPFGRFGPGIDARPPPALETPPYFAIRLYPMTRKSMGGLQVDSQTRVLDTAGAPLPGLFAAGEVTGVAGINGSHGGSGTFLGPSVYTGRIAGRAAAEFAGAQPVGQAGAENAPAPPDASGAQSLLSAEALDALLSAPRAGYWHFEQAHRLVRERAWVCTDCHGPQWPTRTAMTPEEKRVQLESCTRCH